MRTKLLINLTSLTPPLTGIGYYTKNIVKECLQRDIELVGIKNGKIFNTKDIMDLLASLESNSAVDHSSSLKKIAPEVYVDLSAIAKGYGVDQIALLLEKQGIGDYLVEVGGELRSKGLSPRGDTWRIGIERPSEGERGVQQAVKLGNGALATSGDYRNYYERAGVRYSHTIDARTGMPIGHKLASVSVYHASTALADGWATALMVLGEVEGPKVAESLGLAAYFLYRDGEDFAHHATAAFVPLIKE